MNRYGRISALILWTLAAAISCGKAAGPGAKAAGPGAAAPAAVGIDEMARLDLLPRFKRSVRVGLVSSYDRTGGNDDGFSGKYSFVRKEPGGLVLADLEGPGAIYRIHTPTPTEDVVEFYFDGEAAPRLRLKVIELFDGTRPPFLAPLAGSGVGGYTSYVPLTFRKSCKILLRAEAFQFYDINYAVFPAGFDLPTYEDPPTAEFLTRVEKAASLLRRTGTDIADAVAPPGAALAKKTVKVCAPAGRTGDALREPRARTHRRAQDRAGGGLRGGRSRRPPARLLGRRRGAGDRVPRRRPLRLQLRRSRGEIADVGDGGRRPQLPPFPHAL